MASNTQPVAGNGDILHEGLDEMVADVERGNVPAVITEAAALICRADGLLITAGAGIGVDSGLPDFRGNEGLWNAYPALGRRRIAFERIACPDAFASEPALAWGFYGHRLRLYRNTVPHSGFARLLEIAAPMPQGCFVFTSNVDGQFQRAGFDGSRVCEVHGSIHHLQCIEGCQAAIWPADGFVPEVDEAACRLTSPLPRCPDCGGLARPNILMFDDGGWLAARTLAQERRLAHWLEQVRRPVVVEIGAGTHVATVRRFSERFAGTLVRINPTDATIPGGRGASIGMGARAAVEALAAALRGLQSGTREQRSKAEG